MNTQANFSGYLLALAGTTFWFSWLLVPDPGATEGVAILNIVKDARESVYYSSVVQIISAGLYVIALFLLAHLYGAEKRTTLFAIILFGIGAMGICADAFFHLLAYNLTDEHVLTNDGIISVMTFMQNDAMKILIALLVPFFIGSLLLAYALNRQGNISKIPMVLNLVAWMIMSISFTVTRASYLTNVNLVSLSVLGLVAMSHILLGSELIISIQNDEDLTERMTNQPQEIQ